MSEVSSRFVKANGINLAVHECGQEYQAQQPTLVLVHATGFHGRCWDQVIQRLEGRHVIAVDQRGHGASEQKPFHNWAEFGEDLAALLTELGVNGVEAVGHSMGGHASVAAAAHHPALFSKLLLIDPVILDPSFYAMWDEQVLTGEPTHPAARRRSQFSSRDDMYDRYRERLPFSLFTEAAMRDYCHHGLVDNDEGVQLACAPAHEARIYDSVCSNQSILEQAKTVSIPVTVARSMQPTKPEDIMDFRYSPTWKQLASQFPNGEDRLFEHLTHFMPMQDPDQVAQLIREL
ncbi:MAG: alpha/beta hydrolase [Cellvibrionaceae bacterium]|nr:alpha/beta hydrolase [Cellvibrionaceae bacterium]